MRARPQQKQIFREASKTHYYSTILFPPKIRDEVTILYAFARVIDNIVDESESLELAKKRFYQFKEEYLAAKKKFYSKNLIIHDFVKLKKLRGIPDEHVESLFTALEWDLEGKTYETIAELEEYMYGVAVVIGLMMNRIFGVSRDADEYAFAQGYAAQWANIMRDIGVDLREGRIYVPKQELRAYGFEKVARQMLESEKNREKFMQMYTSWKVRLEDYVEAAKPGYDLLPKRLALPIKTATDQYIWSVNRIQDNPKLLFDEPKSVKPHKIQVFYSAFKNLFTL
jgi:phytoene synthase